MDRNEKTLQRIISEELTKSDVNSMISSKLNSTLSSREFKQKVKELSSDVINELFKLLWQRNNIWKSSVSR
jgi:predicted ATPase